MPELPAGTVTLLFSDVAGSTALVKSLGEGYGAALATHRDLLRQAFAEHGGNEVDTQGDSFFVAFARAPDALAAAVAAQSSLSEYAWPGDVAVVVRIGLHTGEPYRAEHGYTGVAVHRAARICSIAHGGQVLLTRATAGIVDDEEMPGVTLRDLGEYPLKDFERQERVFQVVAEGLPADFPPLRVDQQAPLTGTVTIVVIEGRRMMRLADEVPAEQFGSLLAEYQRLLRELLEGMGGREVEVAFDSAIAAFATARKAVAAAIAAQRAVATHEWPGGSRPAISVGLHSGEAGIGWVGPAASLGSQLCDIAEGGQIVLSQATAALLEDQNIGDLSVRDLGAQPTRHTGQLVRVYELVVPLDSR